MATRSRIYTSRRFDRFAKDAGLDDAVLRAAVECIETGLVSADLGGHVIKQRVARKGQGKSGGYRTIILFRQDERAVFVFGFAKNAKANLTGAELEFYRELAKDILALSEAEMSSAVKAGSFREILRLGE